MIKGSSQFSKWTLLIRFALTTPCQIGTVVGVWAGQSLAEMRWHTSKGLSVEGVCTELWAGSGDPQDLVRHPESATAGGCHHPKPKGKGWPELHLWQSSRDGSQAHHGWAGRVQGRHVHSPSLHSASACRCPSLAKPS